MLILRAVNPTELCMVASGGRTPARAQLIFYVSSVVLQGDLQIPMNYQSSVSKIQCDALQETPTVSAQLSS